MGGLSMEHRKPLGFSLGAYRPQRHWAVRDTLETARLERLPAAARAYYETFLREYYAVDARRVRTGLHADVPRRLSGGTARDGRWWRGVERLWPTLGPEQRSRAVARARAAGMRLQVDASRRRSLYVDQNRATRDVFALGRVELLEEGEQ